MAALDKRRWEKERHTFRRWRRHQGSVRPSLDVQDVALFQPKLRLVFVKEVEQGFDVHRVIEIHRLLCGILNPWHCDWLSN